MALLTKDAILGSNDRKTEEITVPEWGGSVLIKTMSGAERDSFEMAITSGTSKSNIRARFAAAVIVDEKGKRMFTDAEIVKLGEKSASALDRVLEAGQRLNKFSDKDIEELAKD